MNFNAKRTIGILLVISLLLLSAGTATAVVSNWQQCVKYVLGECNTIDNCCEVLVSAYGDKSCKYCLTACDEEESGICGIGTTRPECPEVCPRDNLPDLTIYTAIIDGVEINPDETASVEDAAAIIQVGITNSGASDVSGAFSTALYKGICGSPSAELVAEVEYPFTTFAVGASDIIEFETAVDWEADTTQEFCATVDSTEVQDELLETNNDFAFLILNGGALEECIPDATRACGPGTSVGLCVDGIQSCLATGVWGECQNAVYPAPELCDSYDNDCDGDVDESCEAICLEDGQEIHMTTDILRDGVFELPCDGTLTLPKDTKYNDDILAVIEDTAGRYDLFVESDWAKFSLIGNTCAIFIGSNPPSNCSLFDFMGYPGTGKNGKSPWWKDSFVCGGGSCGSEKTHVWDRGGTPILYDGKKPGKFLKWKKDYSIDILAGEKLRMISAEFGGSGEINGDLTIRYDQVGSCSTPTCTTGSSCTDEDSDGFAIEGGDCGSVDCADNDPLVHPAAPEICGDLKDNDCDGEVDEEPCIEICSGGKTRECELDLGDCLGTQVCINDSWGECTGVCSAADLIFNKVEVSNFLIVEGASIDLEYAPIAYFEIDVENIGTDATGNFAVTVYESSCANASESNVLQSYAINSLAAGNIRKNSFQSIVSWAGDQEFCVMVDSANNVNEGDETNNTIGFILAAAALDKIYSFNPFVQSEAIMAGARVSSSKAFTFDSSTADFTIVEETVDPFDGFVLDIFELNSLQNMGPYTLEASSSGFYAEHNFNLIDKRATEEVLGLEIPIEYTITDELTVRWWNDPEFLKLFNFKRINNLTELFFEVIYEE
ncbi:MAG: hypothetical protein CL943_00260 [Candidatus Diapherotrites archaeon]|uniref:CARDB domain-containing protein n=1 Tax=Candidatus Iainarchaeum sp. TaxID=3101447 RepID=A0A2D6LZY6_9ARCH|nr:hypothetical protein [Candidatus Diapherotrites archaeon]|tara:strand:- start:3853 stop:6351 length:2499 start_codon:yes stop_codon:yes gene_type:complete